MSNIKGIIDFIEQNREIMNSQVNKLSEFSSDLVIPVGEVDGSTSLLNTVMVGQFQKAANALNAISEVQSNFYKAAEQNQAKRDVHLPEIIDAEIIEIPKKEKTDD